MGGAWLCVVLGSVIMGHDADHASHGGVFITSGPEFAISGHRLILPGPQLYVN